MPLKKGTKPKHLYEYMVDVNSSTALMYDIDLALSKLQSLMHH